MEIAVNLVQTNGWIGVVMASLVSLMPFAIMGFLFAKHRKEEPSYLISFDRMKGLENAWTLLLVITAPLVFIYNVFVWTAYAFVVFADFISSVLKKIYEYLITPILKAIMWVLNALLWVFLNLIWVPVKMSAKAFYHYCIIWIWDLYKTSFLALNGTYNKSKLRVAFIGSFYTLAIIGVSVYLSLLTGLMVIGMIGLVISCLPIIKSYGTLTSIIHGSEEADHNAHGSHVMKTALNYVIAVLVSIVVIEALLFLSIIPDFGLVFLGIAVNANVFLSAIVILALIVLFFAKAILPNHLLHNEESVSFQDSVVSYLYSIRDKGIQILVSLIPGSMWSVVVLAIPVLFVYASISMADSFKETTIAIQSASISEDLLEAHSKALTINETLEQAEEAFEDAIALSVRSNQNSFALGFPQNVIESPEMIFSNNTTDYTLELPKMYKAAVSDTMSLRDQIKNAERNIVQLNSEINEYKSQKWEYIVQRKNIKEDKDSWVTISSGADVSRFVDKDVKEGESYLYRVKAKNSKGVSKWSSEVNNRIPTTSLRSPSYLIVKTNLNFEVVMHWTDNSYNEDGFIVERKLLGSAKWALLANVDSDVRQYTDNTIVTGKTYEYRVHAVGIGEKSNPTNIVSRRITLPSPYNVTDQSNIKSVLVNWAYSAWDYKRASFYDNDNNVDNKAKGAYVNDKLSFVENMQNKIADQQEIIDINKEKLAYAIQRIEMFASLINYDSSQRTTLKVFKNIAFIFALLFISLFGGVILSVIVTYSSSLFYNVYKIRSNDSWYFLSLVNEEKAKSNLQPLLGFTWPILLVVYFATIGGGLSSFLAIFSF
jgi:hypothetical protein